MSARLPNFKYPAWAAHELGPNEPFVEVPMDFLGHKSTTMMHASQAKLYLKHLKAGERERLRHKWAEASEAYREKPTVRRRQALINAIDRVTSLLGCKLHERFDLGRAVAQSSSRCCRLVAGYAAWEARRFSAATST